MDGFLLRRALLQQSRQAPDGNVQAAADFAWRIYLVEYEQCVRHVAKCLSHLDDRIGRIVKAHHAPGSTTVNI